MLYELIYTSTASNKMEADDLLFLLDQSRTKNARLAVTGLLLYCDRQFMQLIEGEKEVILSLWETIRADERHIFPKVVYEGPIERRGFADWSMGFRELDEIDVRKLHGYSNYLQQGFTSEIVSGSPSKARRLLSTISEVFFKQ